MPNSDPIGLLNRAHAVRAEAARARRLAAQQPDEETRLIVTRFANEMDAKATVLEKLSFTIVPAEIKTRPRHRRCSKRG